MIVPITVTGANTFSPKLVPSIAKLGHDELFLIELQGTLDVECPEWTAKDGQLIGVLNTTEMMLTIGHHLLEGKVASLSKPLGVLQKRVRSSDEEKEVRWDLVAVVKKKIVFSKRPMPIASRKPVGS